jgi:hypothetical protein
MNMTKTTRNLALLAAFAIFVAGCTTLLNTQADSWADQAEQIARNCPAAAEKAAEARQAANKAADLGNRLANIQRTSAELESARDRLKSAWGAGDGDVSAQDRIRSQFVGAKLEAAQNRAYAEMLRNQCATRSATESCTDEANSWDARALEKEQRANELLFGDPDDDRRSVQHYADQSAACARNAERWRQHQGNGSPAGLEYCGTTDYDSNGHVIPGSYRQCQSASDCSEAAENEARWGREHEAEYAAQRAETNSRREQAIQAANDIVALRMSLNRQRGELYDLIATEGKRRPDEAADVLGQPGNYALMEAGIVQGLVEELSNKSHEALLESQRIAAEQCGEGAALQEAPPNPSLPSGEYPQDILNSQPMGLPGGPAPLACCSTNPMCAICTGGCPAFCSACNTGC